MEKRKSEMRKNRIKRQTEMEALIRFPFVSHASKSRLSSGQKKMCGPLWKGSNGDVIGVEQGPLVYECLVEDRFVSSRVPAASGMRGTLVIRRQVAKGPEPGMARSARAGRGVYSFDCGR
jgi:hypothetical protein